MKAASKEIGSKRFYPCGQCGVDHPSATTLLGMISSPALMGWSAKHGTAKLKVLDEAARDLVPDKVYGEIRKHAEERWSLMEPGTALWKSGREQGKDAADDGTLAHAWLEADCNGKSVSLDALSVGARKAVEGYLEWKKSVNLEVVATEETFCNCSLGYAGTADIVARIDGELCLGDWKTSSGIFPTYPIQAWSYALADELQHGDRLYRRVFIGRFGKDGTWEVRVYKRNDFPGIETARQVMTACKALFDYNEKWNAMFPYKRNGGK